jgi:4-amino-4-deoxy-L-arabinose transferase-like glycosyltransferase
MVLLSLLVAVAPLQIHLAQRALIDGYFAFWAVLCAWFLWENLRMPNHPGWLCAFGISLFVLILTKENAAFVFAALAITYLVFQIAGLDRGGSVTVLFVSLGAVLLALIILAGLVGGLGDWISFYQMFVRKSAAMPYARIHQDGPWFRYLIDFLLLSPLVAVFALARLFRIDKQSRADLFWALFLGSSYVVMSVIPYGQSLRFAAYWDLPLRWLALSQLLDCASRFRRFNPVLAVGLTILVFVSVDLFQYWRYFVWGAIYDPVSFQLFRVSGFVK